MLDLPPQSHFSRQNLAKTTVAVSILLFAGGAFAPTHANAASLSLFHEHDVAEFTDPTGRVAKTVTDLKAIDRTMRHDKDFSSRAPCCAMGGATNVIRSFASGKNEQFGSSVSIRAGDVGAETRTITAGGQIAFPVQMNGEPRFNFRISKTSLEAAQGTTARLNFEIVAHQLLDPSLKRYGSVDEVLAGPTVKMGQYEAILYGGDRNTPTPSLSINQSGFDVPLPEPDFFALGVRNTGWDFGVFEGALNLAPQGFKTGDRVGLSYNWEVSVTSDFGGFPGTASASFFDPITAEGGLSFDRTNLLEIPISPIAAVPLPAGIWFLFTGFLALALGGSRRGKPA